MGKFGVPLSVAKESLSSLKNNFCDEDNRRNDKKPQDGHHKNGNERIGKTSCQNFLGFLNPSLRISDKIEYVNFNRPNPADLSKSAVSYSSIGSVKQGF
jgi:hypothetical protein